MNQFLNKRENCLCRRRTISYFGEKDAQSGCVCAVCEYVRVCVNENYNHHGRCFHADFIVSHRKWQMIRI